MRLIRLQAPGLAGCWVVSIELSADVITLEIQTLILSTINITQHSLAISTAYRSSQSVSVKLNSTILRNIQSVQYTLGTLVTP